MKEIYYRDKQGDIFCSSEAHIAFRFITGLSPYEYNHRKGMDTVTPEYVKFLDDVLTKRGAYVIHPSFETLMRAGKKYYAAKLYKTEHKCNSNEAIEAVRQYLKKEH